MLKLNIVINKIKIEGLYLIVNQVLLASNKHKKVTNNPLIMY